MSIVSATWRTARRYASAVLSVYRESRDRWLHAGRHRRALARLRQARQVRRIIVVCHGNICRSPYLEAELRRLMPEIDVSSAGLMGPGRPVPENSTIVAARRGLELSTHRSQLLTGSMLGTAGLVIVMEEGQGRYLTQAFGVSPGRIMYAGDLDPKPGSRAIRDPWQQRLEVFEASFARLDRCASALAKVLREQMSATAADRGSAQEG